MSLCFMKLHSADFNNWCEYIQNHDNLAYRSGYDFAKYVGEVVGNGLFGKQYDVSTEWKDTVSSSIFGWLVDFIKWLFRI